MKKFCSRLLLFLLPVFLLMLIDLFSPLQAFTFRQWEALVYNYAYLSNGGFYPNEKITMTEYGDMGRHTKYQIAKHTTWTTDAIGYRNRSYISNPDIVLIGDSFFAGSSLSDENTITEQLNDQLNQVSAERYRIYNLAPTYFQKADLFFRSGILAKPRIVVLAIEERSINGLKPVQFIKGLTIKEKLTNTLIKVIPQQLPVTIDRMVKFNLIHYIGAKINPIEWINKIKEKQEAKNDAGTVHLPKMFFYKTADIVNNEPDNVTNSSMQTLLSYKKYCDSMGVVFIFIPVPCKESVYYEQVPGLSGQKKYLFKLDSALQANKILTINALDMYNQARKNNPGKMLYQYDDTHWNAEGVHVLANKLSGVIDSILHVKQP